MGRSRQHSTPGYKSCSVAPVSVASVSTVISLSPGAHPINVYLLAFTKRGQEWGASLAVLSAGSSGVCTR